MNANMGAGDRIVRVLLAALVAGLYFGDVITGTWGLVLLAVAAVFTLTGFIGTCPLYSLLGFSTRKA